jgi:polar amino acid transport system substrate-binding protein
MRVLTKILGMVLAAGLPLMAGSAQADVLKNVKEAGKIRIAMDLGIPPWSYKDENLKNTGSEVETAELFAKDLGVELEIVPTTGANRIPFLLSGKADIVLSTLGITDERKKIIQYSIPYSGANNVVAAPKNMAIASFADLSGKTIGVTRGTMLDTAVTAGAPSDATVVRFEDEATTMSALVSGQVPIIGQTEALIGQINKRNPSLNLEPKFVLTTVYYGIAMRKGEDAMQTYANEWVKTNLANGKLAAIYKKFQGSPLPEDILAAKPR